jgi:hypothetical protein
MRVLYLGLSGVTHPSATTYHLVRGADPWSDGHTEYEAVPWLAHAMEAWPDVQIVLTSTQPWKHGLPAVLRRMPALAGRVVGHTFEELTTQPVRLVRSRSGASRRRPYSSEEYWRMNKADVVAAHVDWFEPEAWVAVDDEDILWRPEHAAHVCIVDGCEGLRNPAEQDRLLCCLRANFGPPRDALSGEFQR